jgi:hypothetical protein
MLFPAETTHSLRRFSPSDHALWSAQFTPPICPQKVKAPETFRLLALSGCHCRSSDHASSLSAFWCAAARFPRSPCIQPCLPIAAVPGCPVQRILQQARRTIRRVSPISRCLAVPAMDFRVAPNLACFRGALVRSSGLPLPSDFAPPLIRPPGCPGLLISGFAGDGSSSRPDSHILRRCRW